MVLISSIPVIWYCVFTLYLEDNSKYLTDAHCTQHVMCATPGQQTEAVITLGNIIIVLRWCWCHLVAILHNCYRVKTLINLTI